MRQRIPPHMACILSSPPLKGAIQASIQAKVAAALRLSLSLSFFPFFPPGAKWVFSYPACQGDPASPLSPPVSPIAHVHGSKRCGASLAALPVAVRQAARASFQAVMQPKWVFLTAAAPSSSLVEFRLVLFTLITPKAGLFAGL